MSKKEQNADKKVRIIEADPELSKKNDTNRILKVAAYCRVSTDDEDQLNSYHTQMAYYTEYIKRNPRWRFAGIYADEGIKMKRYMPRAKGSASGLVKRNCHITVVVKMR